MGWSGYYQILCRNGHYHECDGYDDPDFNLASEPHENYCGEVQKPWKCYHCQSFCRWWNLVHTTNGRQDEEATRVSLTRLTEEKREKCNLGHWHIIKEATFEIPEDKGHLE